MDLTLYQAFAAAVEHGSISTAARELGVSRPTLSRQLAALEARLGVVLLHRSTRAAKPSAAGRRIYDQARPHLDGLARLEARTHAERDGVHGILRVSVSPVIVSDTARVLVGLQRQHPQLGVALSASDRWADLRADGADVALRAGRIDGADLVRRRLGAREVFAVASPSYAMLRGLPRSVDELASHVMLLATAPEGTTRRTWPLRDGGRVTVGGTFVADDQVALMSAAEAGGGIALVSELNAAEALAAGRLVKVLPDVIGTRLTLYAVHAHGRRPPARVRVFIDAVVTWFGRAWR